jgi:hypothetical protein
LANGSGVILVSFFIEDWVWGFFLANGSGVILVSFFIEDWVWGFFLAYGSAIILCLFVHVVNNGSIICICYMSSLTGAKTKHNLTNE